MCHSEIAEFSQKKFKNLEVKTIESAGHPVAWSPEIAGWVTSNLAFKIASLINYQERNWSNATPESFNLK